VKSQRVKGGVCKRSGDQCHGKTRKNKEHGWGKWERKFMQEEIHESQSVGKKEKGHEAD